METTGGRLLALDVGTLRIGVAVCDALRVVASPLTTVQRQSVARDSVEIAENGAEALQRYRDGPASYSLILMDCEMSVVDGFEATRRIRAHEQREHLERIPVVALTAHVLDSHRLEGMAAGMDDYLAKPVENEQLFACLRRLIRPATP